MTTTNNSNLPPAEQNDTVIKVQILCPSKRCPRCKKITAKTKRVFEELGLGANFEIITELKGILKFRTWILPTVVINGKIASRGIYPHKEKILRLLKSGKD